MIFKHFKYILLKLLIKLLLTIMKILSQEMH